MKSDLEIAESAVLQNIEDIAAKVGLKSDEIEHYGAYKAKIKLSARESRDVKARTILVTAMTPTPAGEGKTTTSIGLCDAFNRIGKKTIVTLREPSLGPVFGVKGGATGAGYSQVLPMLDINLHFTGDKHAIGSAHNLLAAMIDNYYFRIDELNACIQPSGIVWNRTLDMNDRPLRYIVIGLGEDNGQVRQSNFEITAASEIMAIMGLALDIADLRQRLKKIIVAIDTRGVPIYAEGIGAHGAMTILLKDALMPNLVQTIEGNPAIIHTGPFANIAHGTNSIIAMDMARRLADFIIVESGFGSDLGGEKFFDLVSRQKGAPTPDAVVIVATIRAVKHHGGISIKDLSMPDLEAIKNGYVNLQKHIEIMRSFNRPVFVAINRFSSDTPEELETLKILIEKDNCEGFIIDVFEKGGEGAIDLAKACLEKTKEPQGNVNYVYDLKDQIKTKIEKIAKNIYGSADVHIPRSIRKKMEMIENWGYGELPVCMAKTQYSFSDDPNLKGKPIGDTLEVRDAKVCAGAGFIVVYSGEIMTMPGLPKNPAAVSMDINEEGKIVGLF